MALYRELAAVPRGRYGLIYADPPWSYIKDIRDRRFTHNGIVHIGPRGRHASSSPDAHYPTMPPSEIARLPVGDIAAGDAWLMLWCVWSELPAALKVMEAWGFKYSTLAFCWVKVGSASGRPTPGQGFTTLSGCEGCLVGKRGSLSRAHPDVQQVLMAPRGRHSAKPAEMYRRLDRLLGGVPRIELFARGLPPPGWDAWGNEVDTSQRRLDGEP